MPPRHGQTARRTDQKMWQSYAWLERLGTVEPQGARDLHQGARMHTDATEAQRTAVGLEQRPIADAHPWLTTPVGSKALRVGLCVLATWSIAFVINTLLTGAGQGEYFLPSMGWLLGVLLVPAILCAALAAVSQRWLTRVVPFTQSLLFGLLSYVSANVIAAVLAIVDALGNPHCGSESSCTEYTANTIMFVGFVFLPLILVATIGYGLALATVTPSGRSVRAWLVGATVCSGLVLAAALTFQ